MDLLNKLKQMMNTDLTDSDPTQIGEMLIDMLLIAIVTGQLSTVGHCEVVCLTTNPSEEVRQLIEQSIATQFGIANPVSVFCGENHFKLCCNIGDPRYFFNRIGQSYSKPESFDKDLHEAKYPVLYPNADGTMSQKQFLHHIENEIGLYRQSESITFNQMVQQNRRISITFEGFIGTTYIAALHHCYVLSLKDSGISFRCSFNYDNASERTELVLGFSLIMVPMATPQPGSQLMLTHSYQ